MIAIRPETVNFFVDRPPGTSFLCAGCFFPWTLARFYGKIKMEEKTLSGEKLILDKASGFLYYVLCKFSFFQNNTLKNKKLELV
jgi:hypothetical protein